MPYAGFTLDTVTAELGLDVVTADLFPGLAPLAVSPWLRETLDRGSRQVLVSEKARSEFIVVPILIACEELCSGPVAIYSGERLDVDPARGLIGECDFLLSPMPPLPSLRAPLVTIVEAKKHDIENGIWQCFAQMFGARIFNERRGRPSREVFGCVTNADLWQFLRLADDLAEIDRRRYYLSEVAAILAAFVNILGRAEGGEWKHPGPA